MNDDYHFPDVAQSGTNQTVIPSTEVIENILKYARRAKRVTAKDLKIRIYVN